MKNVLVTGGSGKAGRAVCRDLVEHGYNVLNVDRASSTDPVCPFLKVDLCDFGQTMAMMNRGGGADSPFRPFGTPDAIVHFAAIPAPELATDDQIFHTNILSTYNVFEAAVRTGIRRIVWASSETTLGLPFSPDNPPAYAPVDEDHPMRPESSYSLSKDLGEEMARQYCRWNPDLTMIGLRLSNVMEPDGYAQFEGWQDDTALRQWNMWGYIDARDAAQATRKALNADLVGADCFVIANSDTTMKRNSADLMADVFPDVELRTPVDGRETLLSIAKARRILGFDPKYNWLG
ncbi:NAD(P)-dependent oxidoreductase [Ruegeria sp.]|uniref:NAD-dependent epimerase/dehydratase family protein n=1 Tax=Ruegeria sp. TaxID=1879320 RepID=UPI00232249FF|nr:NAD(P)-dependent oxidoreductase [Ruegeria sp.]MDA7963643.1 NAD(P)-dependent oxidoreductase [Ruegeria sp.]